MKKYAERFMLSALMVLFSAMIAVAAPVMLFDQAHDQRFVIAGDEPLQLSGLAAVMRAEGYDVRSTADPLTDESLKDVDVLVSSGPFMNFIPDEVAAVSRFINRGGRFVAMLHIASPFADMLQRLEVNFSNNVLKEQENIIDGDSRNFKVKDTSNHQLFAGIDHFSLYGGWALINSAPSARVIAKTSPRAWVDLDGDKILSKGDAIGSFGVVVSGEYGAGRFLVFGDDAIFQNRFLDDQNRQLARNLARWLK